MVGRVLLLACLGLVAGCAAAPQPASQPSTQQVAIARPCQHLVSSQVHLPGAVLTTSKCAD